MNMLQKVSLSTISTGFQLKFQEGYDAISGRNPAVDDWKKIATVVPSTAADEEYGWLEGTGKVREWLGDRQINRMAQNGYKIKNRDFENTVGVKVNDLSDGRLGRYSVPMQSLGADVRNFPNELVFGLLAKGHQEACHDGEAFFSADHPAVNAAGKAVKASNVANGGGPAWYLIDASQIIAPIIYQEREKFNFVAKDKPTDDNWWERKELLYGVDGRCNVGFGLWHMAFKSTKPLTSESLQEARVAMGTQRNSKGAPMGVRGTLLVCGWSNELVARTLLKSSTINASDNVSKGVVDMLVTQHLD